MELSQKSTQCYCVVRLSIEILSNVITFTFASQKYNVPYPVALAEALSYQRYFISDGIRNWNALSSQASTAPDLDSFRVIRQGITFRQCLELAFNN